MAHLEEKPDASYVDSMQSYLSGIWAPKCHEKWRRIDTYYNLTFSLWPEGSRRPEWLKPARARSIVDGAVDQQLAFEPKVKRFAIGRAEDHKRKADQVENALAAIMRQAQLLENILTWKQVGKHLLLYGYAIVEDSIAAIDLRRSREKPKRRKGENETEFERRMVVWEHQKKTLMPFRTRAPHPARVLLDPSQKEPRAAVRVGLARAQDLYEQTANRMHLTGQKVGRPKRGEEGDVKIFEVQNNPFELIDIREYWSADWHALVARSELLYVERNTWGFNPYSHAFSGFGQEPTDYPDQDPSYLAVGMLDHILPDLKASAQAQAGRHNALMQASWPHRYTTEDAAEIMSQEADGEIVEIASRDSIWNQDVPNYTRWMFMAEESLEQDIELATYNRSATGVRQVGTNTVGQAAIQATAASKRFIAPMKQLEHLATSSGSHILQLIDVLKLNLMVEGHNIGPNDIEQDYSLRVTFQNAFDPVFQLQLRELGLAEVQSGLLDDETYWTDYAQAEDVTERRKRLLKMFVRKMPRVQMLMAMKAAQEMGIEDLLEEVLEGEFDEAGGEGGGGGGGGGLVGPDGQPLAQSLGRTSPQQGANQISGAVRQLRQPVTPAVTSPGRRGANQAGRG
jgi:hypothetical protein